ncbi:MAG: asparagine--tRNA ligase [Chloroflexi bacterium]|nr:asparagine--tRNA ligase [Chloroflexota bacterium]
MGRHVYVREIGQYVGQEVTIKGWLYNSTDKGKLQFLLVRDGTGILQCVVFQNDVDPQTFENARRVTQESSVIVTGTPRSDKRAPGGYELAVRDMQIFQLAEVYPITPKEHGVGFLMEHRHLWIRSSRQWAILRVRAEVIRAIREWLDSNGFVNVDTPILTPAACEDTTTLFETDYFGTPAYLTQSGQLYNEATIAAFGKVYCFGPTFRAEKSKTRRHLTEFWMVEPEMAYADLNDCMEVEEQLVTHIVKSALQNRRAELELLGRDLSRLQIIEPPFPRIHYDEAVEILRKAGHEFTWGDDFGSPHETEISSQFDKPVFVHHYPKQVKAFYMAEDPQRPETCLSVDLLAPEGYGEIIGGGERTADYEYLEQQIKAHRLPREAYEWYLDLRRYGAVPHSGFGLGVERTVAWICHLSNIRETIAFPRMLERIYP